MICSHNSSCKYVINNQSFFCASFFKQGNNAFRLDGIIAYNREEEKSFPAVCANLFPYISITCGSWEAGKQQRLLVCGSLNLIVIGQYTIDLSK